MESLQSYESHEKDGTLNSRRRFVVYSRFKACVYFLSFSFFGWNQKGEIYRVPLNFNRCGIDLSPLVLNQLLNFDFSPNYLSKLSKLLTLFSNKCLCSFRIGNDLGIEVAHIFRRQFSLQIHISKFTWKVYTSFYLNMCCLCARFYLN